MTLQFWTQLLLKNPPALVRRHHPTSTSHCHPPAAAPASGLLWLVRTCSRAGQQPQSCTGRASCQAGRQAGLSKHCPVKAAAAASWKKLANGSLFFVPKHSHSGEKNKRPECVFNTSPIDFTENTDTLRPCDRCTHDVSGVSAAVRASSLLFACPCTRHFLCSHVFPTPTSNPTLPPAPSTSRYIAMCENMRCSAYTLCSHVQSHRRVASGPRSSAALIPC